MSIYVDDMRAPFGRLIMCHMVADSEEELHAMADKIGVHRRWYQRTMNPHYDICLSKRAAAVAAGAEEVTIRQLAIMCRHRRMEGKLCTPEVAQTELDARSISRSHPMPNDQEPSSLEELLVQEISELNGAAEKAEFIASTNTDRKLRALIFGAVRNLHAAADLIATTRAAKAPVLD